MNPIQATSSTAIPTLGVCAVCHIQPNAAERFGCGHQVCPTCLSGQGGAVGSCPSCGPGLERLIEDLDLLDFSDTQGAINPTCPTHLHPIEFFQGESRSFACFKCLVERVAVGEVEAKVTPVTTNSLYRDYLLLKRRLKKTLEAVSLPSMSTEKLSLFFRLSIEFLKAFGSEGGDIESELEILKTSAPVVSTSNLSIGISSLPPVLETPSVNLAEESLILENPEEEAWVRGLFDRRPKFGLLFRASTANFASSAFHSVCDGRGPTLILIRTSAGKRIGGFAERSWRSGPATFKRSAGSFLFSLSCKARLKPFRNLQRCLFFSPNFGPCFGEDLMIADSANEPKSCRASIGTTFESIDGRMDSLDEQKKFAGSAMFSVAEYEVYWVRFEEPAKS